MTIAANLMLEPPQLTAYSHRFEAPQQDELRWNTLLGEDAEGYRYHLAFARSQVEGFQTGYISLENAGHPCAIAPYFVVDYRLDTTVQGRLKKITNYIHRLLPGLITLRVLCVGSAVTDSCRLGFAEPPQQEGSMMHALHQELSAIAQRSGASVIAFKDVLAQDAKHMSEALNQLGYAMVDNMPVATLDITFKSLDEYLGKLSYSTRKDLRRKLRAKSEIEIEEYDGLPPNLDEIYQLYLNCYERSELKFEKLTLDFFRLVPDLMPGHCRYVLYKHHGKLIGFNLLTYRNGVLLDKYIGLDYAHSTRLNLYFLSWLHNIEMCIRDGFNSYQSGQAAYQTKIKLGARLEQTYIFFQHRNWILKPLLRLAAKVLAYSNFDQSVRSHES